MEGTMQMSKSILATMLVIGLVGLASSVLAGDYTITGNTIQLHSGLSGNDVKMTVTGPDGFHYTQEGATVVSIGEMKAQKDGLYTFEFVEIKVLGEKQVTDDFNGRGQAMQKIVESKVVSGHFRISNGAMMDSEVVE